MVRSWFRKLLYRLRGDVDTETLVRRGLRVGKNFTRMQGTIIDDSHSWLIEIGSDVILAPQVHILAHDASTFLFLGYTRIGRVVIGDHVFIGAGSIILPNVRIGSHVVIGAGSVVTKDVPDRSVAAGNPAKVICTLEDYLQKHKEKMQDSPCYGDEYTMRGKISSSLKEKQKDKLSNRIGYVK